MGLHIFGTTRGTAGAAASVAAGFVKVIAIAAILIIAAVPWWAWGAALMLWIAYETGVAYRHAIKAQQAREQHERDHR